jgi:hypothetical protein
MSIIFPVMHSALLSVTVRLKMSLASSLIDGVYT